MEETTYKNIRYETGRDIVVITIDRYEEARNAIDPHTGIELYNALRRFESDDSLNVAVLTGDGGAFCAGFDLKINFDF